eukprot:Gb_14132 [translate_table: standard]
MIAGGSLDLYDSNKVPRFGVMPRYHSDQIRMKWIDVPDCFCFHLWNAWEEDYEELVITGSCRARPDSIFNESDEPLRSILSEIRLNLRTGSSSRRKIVPCMNLEAGQINRNYIGRKTQYACMPIAEPWRRVSGVAKVDLQRNNAVIGGRKCLGRDAMGVSRAGGLHKIAFQGALRFPCHVFDTEGSFESALKSVQKIMSEGHVLKAKQVAKCTEDVTEITRGGLRGHRRRLGGKDEAALLTRAVLSPVDGFGLSQLLELGVMNISQF